MAFNKHNSNLEDPVLVKQKYWMQTSVSESATNFKNVTERISVVSST